jgi:predicted dithiol-disulfide oxidoreductase (DUF899 family)
MSEIEDLERELYDKTQRLAELKRARPREAVDDHELDAPDGRKVRLSELFGERDDLIVIHNMGRGCSYCTLWADGFNGVVDHLENRAAFVVVSPDPPQVQQEFAKGRGWRFRMLSSSGSGFTEAMGYRDEKGGWLPGISTFRRGADGRIERVATAPFGPGDTFCPTWHVLDLLADGAAGWEPKYKYGS